jgi:hypothetical protein
LLETTTFQKLHFQNDIYSKVDTASCRWQHARPEFSPVLTHAGLAVQYAASLPAKWNTITVDMTYPATEKHIKKARKQQYYMVSTVWRSEHVIWT